MHWLFIEGKCLFRENRWDFSLFKRSNFVFLTLISVVCGHPNRNLERRVPTISISNAGSWKHSEHVQFSQFPYCTAHYFPTSETSWQVQVMNQMTGNWHLHKIKVTKSVMQVVQCRFFKNGNRITNEKWLTSLCV